MKSPAVRREKSKFSFLSVLSFFIALLSLFPCPQYSHPVEGEQLILFQPDGTQIIAYIYGDEFHRRVETEEGYTIILNEKTGNIEYAILERNRLIPSGIVVGTVSPAYLEKKRFPKHLTDRPYRITELRFRRPEIFHDRGSLVYESSEMAVQALTGTKKVFVVCVQFQSETSPPTNWYAGTYAPGGFHGRLFSTNPGDMSMANYYQANSYDQFYPVGYTYPNWVTLPQTASWYEDSSSWLQIIRDAMDGIISQDPSFDFTQYANNGEMDMILIWAGATQTWGDFYWPHMSSTSIVKYGVIVRHYNAVNERSSSGLENTGIGVFCHEYGHMTGCPDLYDYSSQNKPVGYYCIMANSNPGISFCGYLKWKIYGWLAPIDLTAGGEYFVDAQALAAISNPRLYRIMIDDPKEYLLLENRYNGAHPNYENYSSRWSGLFITHVDENYPPAVGQPNYPFYGVEAIVPVLDPTATLLSFYTSYYGYMVFSADHENYSRLDPFFPDNIQPGAFLTLSYTDDDGEAGVEHVIFRNTQGHTKSSDIYFIGISDSGTTMRFCYNVQKYRISGTISPPSSSGISRIKTGVSRETKGKFAQNQPRSEARTVQPAVKHVIVKGGMQAAVGLSNVVMSGLPGNPTSDALGYYSGLVEEGWTGTVTPLKTHYSFVPPSRTYTNVQSDLNSEDFLALRNIYAPYFFEAKTELNRSLSQAEYLNVLTWYHNPANQNIMKYRVYLMDNGNKTLLAELDGEAKKYWHRNIEYGMPFRYAVCAVNDEGREGEYGYVEINMTTKK